MKATHPGRLISAGACALGLAVFSTLPAFACPSGKQVSQAVPVSGQPASTQPASVPPSSQSMPNQPMMQSALSAVDRQFMVKAAQSDMTEIMTSRLALQRSQNPEVRSYAQDMIQEHTRSTQKLMQVARQKGVMLPKDTNADGKALMARLSRLSGSQFDQAYMSGQYAAHSKTEREFRTYLQQGQNAQLRAFASEVLPIVIGHRQMAERMVAGR